MVYNNVAKLINYIDMQMLAYPSTNYQDCTKTIDNVWGTATGNLGQALWSIVTADIVQWAVSIMTLIAYIMTYFLGYARLFLIAVMIVGFPLAIVLRLIPFAVLV